jgi:hypothetical protein
MKVRERLLPVLLLFLIAPMVGEVLLGATPVSRLGGLLPLSALYGGGAVLVRELARRRGIGWGPVFLLAAAYGLIEEGVAVQSLFNPTLFQAGLMGGRALGVNWVWAEWTIGYHVVWSIAIPILIVELLFAARRHTPWLGRPGIIVVGALYTLGVAFVAVVFRKVVAPGFRASSPLLVATALLSAALVLVGLRWRARPAEVVGEAPPPWAMLLVGAVAGGLWFWLLMLPETLKRFPIVPMAAAAAGAVALALWVRRRALTDRHRLALAAGALAPVMIFGFLVVTAGNRLDHRGQAVASATAALLLGLLARRLAPARAGALNPPCSTTSPGFPQPSGAGRVEAAPPLR